MKKITQHAVFVISVLVAYLISGRVMLMLKGIDRLHQNKYLSVLIYMVAIIVVFYPISKLISMFGETVAQSVIKKSQKTLGSPFVGLIIGFILLFTILFCCYCYVIYGITVVQIINALF